MKTYTKYDFYRMVYEKNNGEYPLDDVTWIVKAVFKCMDDILENGDKLVIKEYFTLQRILKEARPANNFGNPCTIPPRYEPLFKPSIRLKRMCKEIEVKEEFGDNEKSQEIQDI